MAVVFQWDFDFKATSARNPATCHVQDGDTGAAYVWGDAPELRLVFGSRRVAGVIEDPLGEYSSNDGSLSYEVVTKWGSTWSFFTFDPDPDDSALHEQAAGSYPFDLELKPDGSEDFEAVGEGWIRITGTVQS